MPAPRWTRQEDIQLVEVYRGGMCNAVPLPGRSIGGMWRRLVTLRTACPVSLQTGAAEHVVDLCRMDYRPMVIEKTCVGCHKTFPNRRQFDNLKLCYGCRRRSGWYRDKRRAGR